MSSSQWTQTNGDERGAQRGEGYQGQSSYEATESHYDRADECFDDPPAATRSNAGMTPQQRQLIQEQQEQATVGYSTSEIWGLERGALGTVAKFGTERVPRDYPYASQQAAPDSTSDLARGEHVRMRPVAEVRPQLSERLSQPDNSEAGAAARDEYLRNQALENMRRHYLSAFSTAPQGDVRTAAQQYAVHQQIVQQQQGAQYQAAPDQQYEQQVAQEQTNARAPQPVQGIYRARRTGLSVPPGFPPIPEPFQEATLPPNRASVLIRQLGDGDCDWSENYEASLPLPDAWIVQEGGRTIDAQITPKGMVDTPASYFQQFVRHSVPAANVPPPPSGPSVQLPQAQRIRMRHPTYVQGTPDLVMPSSWDRIQSLRPGVSSEETAEPTNQQGYLRDATATAREDQAGQQSRMAQEISPQMLSLIAARYAQHQPATMVQSSVYQPLALVRPTPDSTQESATEQYNGPLTVQIQPYCYGVPPHVAMYYGMQGMTSPRISPSGYNMTETGSQGAMSQSQPNHLPSGNISSPPSPFIDSPDMPERQSEERYSDDQDGEYLVRSPDADQHPRPTSSQGVLSNQYIREGRMEPTMIDGTVILPTPPRDSMPDVEPTVEIPASCVQFLYFDANYGRAGPYRGPENVYRGVMRCVKQPTGGAIVYYREDSADVLRRTEGDEAGSISADTEQDAADPHNSYMAFNDMEAAQRFARSLSADGYHARLIEEPCLDDLNVFVHNLPDVMTISDITIAASSVGMVDEVCLGRSNFGVSKLNAFLRMATATDARSAIKFFDRRMMQGYDCELVSVMGYRFAPNALADTKTALIDIRMLYLGYVCKEQSFVYGAYRHGPSCEPSPSHDNPTDINGNHDRVETSDGGSGGQGDGLVPVTLINSDATLTHGLVLVPRDSVGSLEQQVDSRDNTTHELNGNVPRYVAPSLEDTGGYRRIPFEPPRIISPWPDHGRSGAPGASSLGYAASATGGGICPCAPCLEQKEKFMAAERAAVADRSSCQRYAMQAEDVEEPRDSRVWRVPSFMMTNTVGPAPDPTEVPGNSEETAAIANRNSASRPAPGLPRAVAAALGNVDRKYTDDLIKQFTIALANQDLTVPEDRSSPSVPTSTMPSYYDPRTSSLRNPPTQQNNPVCTDVVEPIRRTRSSLDVSMPRMIPNRGIYDPNLPSRPLLSGPVRGVFDPMPRASSSQSVSAGPSRSQAVIPVWGCAPTAMTPEHEQLVENYVRSQPAAAGTGTQGGLQVHQGPPTQGADQEHERISLGMMQQHVRNQRVTQYQQLLEVIRRATPIRRQGIAQVAQQTTADGAADQPQQGSGSVAPQQSTPVERHPWAFSSYVIPQPTSTATPFFKPIEASAVPQPTYSSAQQQAAAAAYSSAQQEVDAYLSARYQPAVAYLSAQRKAATAAHMSAQQFESAASNEPLATRNVSQPPQQGPAHNINFQGNQNNTGVQQFAASMPSAVPRSFQPRVMVDQRAFDRSYAAYVAGRMRFPAMHNRNPRPNHDDFIRQLQINAAYAASVNQSMNVPPRSENSNMQPVYGNLAGGTPADDNQASAMEPAQAADTGSEGHVEQEDAPVAP